MLKISEMIAMMKQCRNLILIVTLWIAAKFCLKTKLELRSTGLKFYSSLKLYQLLMTPKKDLLIWFAGTYHLVWNSVQGDWQH